MYSRVLPLIIAIGVIFGSPAIVSTAWAEVAVFCMRDGKQIKADRFESRDGKFLLFVAGSVAPLEYPASQIASIGLSCPAPGVSSAPTAALTSAAVPPAQATNEREFGVHGSNTIGERLMPMLIEAFAEKRLSSKPVIKLGAAEEQEMTLTPAGGQPATIQLHAHGSGTSAKSLMAGAAQIGMSSRRATEPEVKAVEAASTINLHGSGNEHVLALDGLAVIVSPANPVRQLSLDQIAQIFSGQVTNWSQVGGQNAPIAVHRRDDKSGTYDTFNSLVLTPRKVKPSPAAKAHESSEILSEEVFRDPNAIGFIGLPYVNRSAALQISDVCGLTSRPTQFMVKTETYPLARRLYLYTLGQPKHPMAKDILQFALSSEAQATVREAGFVDQSFELQSEAEQKLWQDSLNANPSGFLPAGKEIPKAAKANFTKALSVSRRTTLVLRFERGSAALDARARQDVERFANFLASPKAREIRFWLVGFADSEGDWLANEKLSAQRAASVAAALRIAGATVPNDRTLAFSYQAPVACNETATGAMHNRRVEIWLTK
jgi:phosphate transport system substrate-binding protein